MFPNNTSRLVNMKFIDMLTKQVGKNIRYLTPGMTPEAGWCEELLVSVGEDCIETADDKDNRYCFPISSIIGFSAVKDLPEAEKETAQE